MLTIATVERSKGMLARDLASSCLSSIAGGCARRSDTTDAFTLGPLDGAIVSIQGPFRCGGEPTRAGSKVLVDAPPAAFGCPSGPSAPRCGAVIVAKTNMVDSLSPASVLTRTTEHRPNPADRARVPGGSTSGGAVAVRMACARLRLHGHGGSTRVPLHSADWSVSSHRRKGCQQTGIPLSFTLDSVGPLRRVSPACAAPMP